MGSPEGVEGGTNWNIFVTGLGLRIIFPSTVNSRVGIFLKGGGDCMLRITWVASVEAKGLPRGMPASLGRTSGGGKYALGVAEAKRHDVGGFEGFVGLRTMLTSRMTG